MRDFAIGNLIKSYRVRADITQEEVAKLLDIAKRTYQTWEAKEPTIPPNTMLRRLATLFGLTDSEADELYRVAAQVAPEIHNLPVLPNDFFTGRKRYLEQLEQYLNETRSVAITQPVSISGLGGIGKTELVLEYTHRHYLKMYRTVLWTNAANKTTLEAGYLSLAQLLKLPEKDEREIDRVVQAVKKWLEGHINWLLILDNADDLTLARTFLPATPRGHILLTTRSQIVGDIATPLVIDVMELEEGLHFLLRRSGVLKYQDKLETVASDARKAAAQLVGLLGGHPLALDQAGAYIDNASCSFDDYIQIYNENRLMLLNERGFPGDKHPEAVAVTFEVSFQRACELCPTVADVLHFCAFLRSDDIPEELFGQDGGLKLDKIMFNKAIRALNRYSLIKRNADKRLLSVHRLVQAVLADGIDAQTQRLWAERVIIALNAILPAAGDHHQWSRYERSLSHLLGCVDLIDRWHIHTPAAAYLLHDTARYLHGRVRFAEAKPLYLRTVEIRQQALGRVHPELMDPLLDLANLCQDEGQYTEAQAYYQEVLDICEQTLAPDEQVITSAMRGLARNYFRQDDHTMALMVYYTVLQAEKPPRVTTLSEAGHVHQRMGHYTGAELLYQQALETCKQTMEPNDPAMSIPLTDLAGLYQEQGKYDQAEALYRQALHIDEQALGSDHPNLTPLLNSLAGLYREQGRYDEAASLLQRALHLLEQVLGADHLRITYPLHGLANVRAQQGQYDEAQVLYQRVLQVREQILGSKHSEVALVLLNLATLSLEQRQYSEAEAFFQRALQILEHLLGNVHPQIADSLYNLAHLYTQQGNVFKAMEAWEHALEIWKSKLGLNHPKVYPLAKRYLALLPWIGRHDEAKSLEAQLLTFSLEDPTTFFKSQEQLHVSLSSGPGAFMNDLAIRCKNQGKYQEAERRHLEVLHIREQTLGADHPDVAVSLNGLATVYLEQGRLLEAEPLYQRALRIKEQAYGLDSPDVVSPMINLATLYYKQKKYEEAETLYRRGLRIWEQALEPNHPDIALVLRNLAQACLDQRKYEEAQQLCQRALDIYEQTNHRDASPTRILYATIRISLAKERKDP